MFSGIFSGVAYGLFARFYREGFVLHRSLAVGACLDECFVGDLPLLVLVSAKPHSCLEFY